MFFKYFFLGFLQLGVTTCPFIAQAHILDPNVNEPSITEIEKVLSHAASSLIESQTPEGAWITPASLGTHYISLYSLALDWISQSTEIRTEFRPSRLIDQLIRTQLADGSWFAVNDANVDYGDHNATIWNYWFLKSKGIAIDCAVMQRARNWILRHGGLEKSNGFTKIIMAIFHNYTWDFFPEIPGFLSNPKTPILNMGIFGQWIGPHLVPFTYFRKVKLWRDLGEPYRIDELWSTQGQAKNLTEINKMRLMPRIAIDFKKQANFLKNLVSQQRPMGSFGGYASSTIFSWLAIEDFKNQSNNVKEKEKGKNYAEVLSKAQNFIEKIFFGKSDFTHSKVDLDYQGVTQDGRYWDTALIAVGLSDSGYISKSDFRAQSAFQKACHYIQAAQVSNGGLPFGLDFEYAPDTDDTAAFIWLQTRCENRSSAKVDRAIKWLYSMQNNDGGWGAFSKNNNELGILKKKLELLKDSAGFYDSSSPDVTGHILEALSDADRTDSMTVLRAIRYLKATQKKEGYWEARWGINAIYGTSAALLGLIKVGEPISAPYIQNALNWLKSVQNADGGFGESTLSYSDPARWAGRGISTPSQTAWAILAFTEAKMLNSLELKHSLRYLIQSFNKNQKWIDTSIVGTGHPGIVYMDYPSYPISFPMMALGRYLNYIKMPLR